MHSVVTFQLVSDSLKIVFLHNEKCAIIALK